MSTPCPAFLDIQRSHWATLTPVIPAIRDAFSVDLLEFSLGGGLGHFARRALSDHFTSTFTRQTHDKATGQIESREMLQLPVGTVGAVTAMLAKLGHPVNAADHRVDSERWKSSGGWPPKQFRETIDAIEATRALRIVTPNDYEIAELTKIVARLYPNARIAVALPTHKRLKAFTRRLVEAFPEEPLGRFTSKLKIRDRRVSLGLIGQFPRGNSGDFDLLVLPDAESTVSDAALEVATSGQYRRILSFSRRRWTSDGDLNRRLQVIAEVVVPPERPVPPVTALILNTPGTAVGSCSDAFELKRASIWFNAKRNARIAALAKAIASKKRKSLAALLDSKEVADELLTAAVPGVAILVETPVHARELAQLLPGWVLWAAWESDDFDSVFNRPAGCDAIVTELGGMETALHAGVLIRATGTPWPLPKINWPWWQSKSGLLVDFADGFHPAVARHAQSRIRHYAGAYESVRCWEAGPRKRLEHQDHAGT